MQVHELVPVRRCEKVANLRSWVAFKGQGEHGTAVLGTVGPASFNTLKARELSPGAAVHGGDLGSILGHRMVPQAPAGMIPP